MHLSEKFPVPGDIALLYDFVNSLDLRHYVEGGLPHVPSDGLATAAELQAWLFERGLATRKATLSAQDHCNALALRHALRSFLQLAPAERADGSEEHTSELQSLMRISYAVFCLKKKNNRQ